MNRKIIFVILLFLAVAGRVRAQQRAAPSIVGFYNRTAGSYQVLAQSGADMAWSVNRFMNEMLAQYSRYFSNWSPKAGARVVVFSNADDFQAYAEERQGVKSIYYSLCLTLGARGNERRRIFADVKELRRVTSHMS